VTTPSTDPYVYPPVGRCIYCGKTDGKLSREHIVPYSLNGNLVLPEASCERCAKKTQKIEEICTHERYGMLHPLRTKLNLQSRRGRHRHKQLPVLVKYQDGTDKIAIVPSAGFPIIVWGLELPKAGILLGLEPSNTVQCEVLSKQ
jgi:HNH endonuclease